VTDARFGINLWSQAATWPELLDAARRVDRLGYDSLWTWDHLYAIIGDPHQPIFEGWGLLHAWAMATERVRLGLMVGANTFRNPGLVAKLAATLDHVSGGRAILGLGGAWMEEEHTAHGIDFGAGFGQRLDWLEESVAACRALLDGSSVTSATGGRYAFRDLQHEPRPLQAHLPIMVGGNGRTKTLRTIARHADMWNGFGLPAELAELDGVLRGHCADVGRDEREITRTSNLWMIIRDSEAAAAEAWRATMAHNTTTPEATAEPYRPLLGPPELIAERLRAYVAAGFSTAIVELPAPYDVETLERLIGEVKPLVDAG
jgi:alkanesulfonate monooxygenase SsuD/methylene tetrahydromethanopterin reductase-like flavin-dependent oxidoreductase (luciferase family)